MCAAGVKHTSSHVILEAFGCHWFSHPGGIVLHGPDWQLSQIGRIVVTRVAHVPDLVVWGGCLHYRLVGNPDWTCFPDWLLFPIVLIAVAVPDFIFLVSRLGGMSH